MPALPWQQTMTVGRNTKRRLVACFIIFITFVLVCAGYPSVIYKAMQLVQLMPFCSPLSQVNDIR